MKCREEVAEVVGWLEGIAPLVWLLPLEKVSDEVPEEYEKRVKRLRELLFGKEDWR